MGIFGRISAAVVVTLLGAAGIGGAAPATTGERPLSAAEQHEVVEGICSEVGARYVFPDVGRAMSARLHAQLAAGAYTDLTSPADLAERLQIDLREVSRDRHLFVVHDPRRAADLRDAAAAGNDDAMSPGEIESSRQRNFGLREVRILDGNVGYLDVRDFEHPSLSGEKIAAAMALLSDCDAVIIDLRNNGGGWPGTTALLASYFFAPGEPVHFTDFYDRVTGETTQSWTLPFVPGRTLPATPLYVLTSGRSFSGAEEFAYNLQAMKRATLVGEKTRGGANTPEDVVVSHDFVLAVPQGRPISPVTGTNWEGAGVSPDLQVPEKLALDTAHQSALERLLSASTAEADRFRFQWALDGVRARSSPATPDTRSMRACAGTYGVRKVTFESGRLYDQRVDRPRQVLIPMGPDLFGIEGFERQRLRFVREGGRVTAVVVLSEDGSSRTISKGATAAP